MQVIIFPTKYEKYPLREKCPYSELFSSVFSPIWTEYGEIQSFLSVSSPNAGKYGPE